MKAALPLVFVSLITACNSSTDGSAEVTRLNAEVERLSAELAQCNATSGSGPSTLYPGSVPSKNLYPDGTSGRAKKVCDGIELAPAHTSVFSVAKVFIDPEWPDYCYLILEAKIPISRFWFDVVQYDADDVKISSGSDSLKNLNPGDKVKTYFGLEKEAVRVVTAEK